MFDYERIEKDNTIRITGMRGNASQVYVPDMLDGHAVTEIGPYAFSGSRITLLDLPRSIRCVGRYALYNCTELKEFCFFSCLSDFGAGAFTGCRRVRKIVVELDTDETSHLRDVLMEIPMELLVEYRCKGHTARLLFPEYYEEGVENTPARIIVSHYHGSGLLYRNCFVNRRLQFGEYDSRFAFALGQEGMPFLFRLSMERLMTPYELSPEAKRTYEKFLTDHFTQAIDYYTSLKETTAVSFLMQLHRRNGSAHRHIFEL